MNQYFLLIVRNNYNKNKGITMKGEKHVTNCNNNKRRRVELEQFSLLSQAVDVLDSQEYTLEQGVDTLLASVKYYCQFDFVALWKFNDERDCYTLHNSSEEFPKATLIKHELQSRELPWDIKDYPTKEYAISKTHDYSIKYSRNTIRLVREQDSHFFAMIPIVINNFRYGMITFSNYKSSNAIPKTIENELKGLSKLISNTIYKKLLIEKQKKYYDLLKLSSSWELLLVKPMPIYLQNMGQLNWLYKYGVISTSSNELAKLFGYREEKEFNGAAVSLNEFMPRNKSNSINFLMNIIKNHHCISNINSSLIDRNKNEYFYKNNIEAKILSGELMTLYCDSVLYNIKIANSNNHQLSYSESNVKNSLDLLTKREFEVLLYVLGGSQNKRIADELGICEKTVKVHRGKVMKKLKICCLAELVRACDHIGLKPKYTSNYYSKMVA